MRLVPKTAAAFEDVRVQHDVANLGSVTANHDTDSPAEKLKPR